jgi:ABC-2 type transport system permease protein
MRSKTLEVAWREFKSTALTRAFILAAVLVPVLIIALGVLGPMLFNPEPPPLKGTIAIVDPDGQLAEAAAIEFAPEKIRERIHSTAAERGAAPSGMTESGSLDPEMMRNPRSMSAATREFDIDLKLDDQHAPDELESLKGKLAAGDLVAIVTTVQPSAPQPATVPAAPATIPAAPPITATVYVPSNMNIKHTGLIEDLVQSSAARARIESAGYDVQTVRELARAPQPATVRISKEGQERAEGAGTKIFKMMVPMAFMMLLWIGTFVSANYLLTTTIEEKSNKVMEVLLSAVSPMQLMTGKIIGQAMVGLVMVGMYLIMGVIALIAMAAADLIEWQTLAFFGLYYVMAYFMISSIMAAIGSAVNELREAQSLMTPAMLILMIPLMLWLPISDSPNGTLATVTSFIPPLIPFVMILRIAGSEPIPTWQIIASLAIGYPAMIAMIWMAARIFRVGVLMYGKPPSPLELLKWVRYA